MKVNPWVSMATPVFWICSSTYQLMKELFPAEWLPIRRTVIFFLGGKSVSPTDLAASTSPFFPSAYSSNTSLRILSLTLRVLASMALAVLAAWRCFNFPISPDMFGRGHRDGAIKSDRVQFCFYLLARH